MSNLSLVSVIIPTYNRAHLIVDTLRSVQTQTYPNWECIVVDDASTDNTAEVVEGLQDPRIQFISLSKKGNANVARNKGVEMAKGEYVAFLDSDDRYLPNHLETGLQILQREEAGLLVSSYYVFLKDVKSIRITRALRKNENPVDFLLSDGFAQSSGLILKKKFANKIKWNETLRSHQDYDYFEQLVNLGVKVAANTIPAYEIHWNKKRVIAFEDCIRFMEPRAANIDIQNYLNYLISMHHSVIEFSSDNKFKMYYKKEIEKRAEYLSYKTFSSLQENNKGLYNFYHRFRYSWLIVAPEISRKFCLLFLKK